MLYYQKNEHSKFKLCELLNYHIKNCKNALCICKISKFFDNNSMIIKGNILILIENIFNLILKTKQIKKDLT